MKSYDVKVIDNCVDDHLRELVWDYLQEQSWSIAWKKPEKSDNYDLLEMVPSEQFSYYKTAEHPPHMFMPRAVFGSDEISLKSHIPIYKLWESISKILNDEFVIEGKPEGFPASHRIKKFKAPQTVNPDLEQGWRVYANAQPNEHYKRTHAVHRDQPDLNIDDTYTLLYVANLEWYPTWFGDCIFYTDDETSGDHQQFQIGGQRRDFQVGWGDDAQIVSPKPGRIMLYDSRRLHTTRPASIFAKEDRKVVAFRLRKK